MKHRAHVLVSALLALPVAACSGGDEGPSAELVLARDRAADLGARGSSAHWAEALAVLQPIVAKKDAAAEDLLRAACAQLAIKEDADAPAKAQPLLDRAARLAPDDDVLVWCRYLVAFLQFDPARAAEILEPLHAKRPQDYTVTLALASALDDLDEPESETRAQTLYREFLDINPFVTLDWRMTALYKLATSLQRQGKEAEAAPLYAEQQRLEDQGRKRPGVPSHEPDTLGRIPPQTQTIFDIPEPAPFAPSITQRTLKNGEGAIGAFAPVWNWAASVTGDDGRARGKDAEEQYGWAPRPALVWWGPNGAWTAADANVEPVQLHAEPVLDVAPFDRMNVGNQKSSDKEKKPGDQDLDLVLAVGDASGARLLLLENVKGTWSLRAEPLATLPPIAGAGSITPIDYDHEGDVDLLVTTTGGPRLLRNDGLDGTGAFTDATAEAGLPTGDLLAFPEELDNDGDVDLLWIERAGGAIRASSNERGGRFSNGSATLPSGLRGRSVVPADFDGDGWVDLAVFDSELALHTRSALGAWKPEVRRFALPHAPTGMPRAADVDLDGTLDLVWPCAEAPAAAILAPGFEHGGREQLLGTPFPEAERGPASLEVCDADGDHDVDLLRAGSRGLTLYETQGTGRGILLGLQGHKDNARGVGAIVELRRGLRYQRRFTHGAHELFGFGGEPADLARITWPNGIVQSNYDLAPGSSALIAQRLGQVGSCPFLYTWNGTTYEFISDVLGITPLGLPMAPGMLVPPDHDEYVLVKGEQLVPKDGLYELQFTEELREVTYLDRIRLDVVDHPADVEVFPNERFSFPPFPEAHTHTVRDALVPLSATDTNAKDWKDELARDDRRFAIPFDALPGPYRGLATPWTLELAFDAERVARAERLRLFLNGWFYWTDASVNVSVARHPDFEFVPPLLSVPDGNGGWKDFGPIGFPAGKLKTMAVDVTELLNRADPRIRLTSTLRLYWDSIRLATDADDTPLVTTALEPRSAELWQRGFSRSHALLGEHDCEWFTWDELEPEPRWNQHPGLYTRLGEVVPLLGAIDDRFVIMGSGDALTVRFDATGLPPLPQGWRRDFLVFLDGWAKDRDPNTLEALHVEPLPFHGMSGYPYGPGERYPDDEEHRTYRREWNTRPATRWIDSLVPPRRSSTTSTSPASNTSPPVSIEAEGRSPSNSAPAAPATSG